jgi:uncharacterized repeat protein (TIGR03803 family)
MYSRRQQKPNMGACGSGASHMNTKRRGGGRPRRGRLGTLLGAALIAAAGFSSTAAAQELTTLYSFTGTGSGDGAYPNAGLIADPAGNLYGTTQVGGADPSCNQAPGCGTVFQLTPSATLTVLHSFTGSDGEQPFAGLIADAAGNLYGTTWGGGDNGRGTVFQLDPSGTLTVLHSFTGGSDGQRPVTGLLADAAGNLYGTTGGGGDGGYGTVFQLDPSGNLTVLYSFTGGSDGRNPDSALIADAGGNLYGTTNQGGDLVSCNDPNTHGCGTVFQLTPPGSLTVLHRFAGSDGSRPVDWAGLLADAAGNLYGTTSAGGANGRGTVFQLDSSGTLTVLYSFTGGSDGGDPTAGLIADTAGNLYGTTLEGGATGNCNQPYGCGTVFQLTPSGALTVLHTFTGSDGASPEAGLIADAAGNLYGTTHSGGAGTSCVQGCGTVFELTAPASFTGDRVRRNMITKALRQGVPRMGRQ